jgi:hypothetical protein
MLQIVSVLSMRWFTHYTTEFHFKMDTVCVCVCMCVRARLCPRVPAYVHAVSVALSHRTKVWFI